MVGEPKETPSLELREYLGMVQKYWIMILLIALGTFAAVGVVTFTQTPKYQSSAQLYVSVRNDGNGSTELVQGTNFAQQVIASYVDVVTSDLVLAPVIDELSLNETAQQLGERVTASSPPNTVLLKITGTDTRPEQAAAIADATAASFIDVVENQLEKSEGDRPSMVKLQTIQPATIDTNPVSPNKPRNLALGLLLGLMLSFGAAIVRKTLDTRIHTPADIENVTDAPMLGAIINDPDAAQQPLIVHVEPHNPRSESFRTLRTNLQFLVVESAPRTYVISSASPSEGKTTTAANIAISLAEAGARVALVGADLRRPKVAEYMGIEGAVGLSDVLIGRAELQDVTQRWGAGELYVLPSGRIPPNPSELLGSESMQQLLNALEGHFEYVIIDSPPLLAVTDAAVVAKWTRGVILIAASSETRKGALDSAIQRLEAARVDLLGIVMTKVPTRGPDSYSYGSYAYTDHEESKFSGHRSSSRVGRHGRSRRTRT